MYPMPPAPRSVACPLLASDDSRSGVIAFEFAGEGQGGLSFTAVIGAGPGGLAAAWELAGLGLDAVVLEQDAVVGGIARTVTYRGYRFDIGGHRFFSKVSRVREMWEEVLGEDLLERDRLSRIYYGGRFFHYPLRPVSALVSLGPVEAARVVASYAAAQLAPIRDERTFEQWVVNRFGRRLYEIFFKTYTEKVWGMPCSEIGAEWASQRIKNLDLKAAIKSALLGSRSVDGEVITSLIDRFHYPRLGPGMMWERCRDRLAQRGIPTHTGARVTRVRHDGRRVLAVLVRESGSGDPTGATAHTGDDGAEREQAGEREIGADHVIASMPLSTLVRVLDPAPPPEVLAAASSLRYRDFLTVGLIVEREKVFPDTWIYVHAPEVKLGRIQNFKNWSPEMVPDPSRTSLGLEYFVQRGDELWTMDDATLVELGTRECETLGLLRRDEVVDGTVIRMPRAYPVYDEAYRDALPVLRDYLGGFSNLHVIGRNGQHRYNNQDHSMLAGMLAARNVAGEAHDVWAVNVESEYHEEVRRPERWGERLEPAAERGDSRAGDRQVPAPARAQRVEDLVREAFARYDPVALGGAVGIVLGAGLLIATVLLLVRSGRVIGPTLSLLGHYLYGFRATWWGAALGAVEAALYGFALGWVLARAINWLVDRHETAIRRRLELIGALDPFGAADR
jgi:protoporphyrinogen oxidase